MCLNFIAHTSVQTAKLCHDTLSTSQTESWVLRSYQTVHNKPNISKIQFYRYMIYA